MDRKQIVLVPCTFRRGAFPHERSFVIPFPDGSEYRGIVPVDYCFRLDRTPLDEGPSAGSAVEGVVVGLLFARNKEDGTARIELPDGDVYVLGEGQFYPVRAEDGAYIAIRDED